MKIGYRGGCVAILHEILVPTLTMAGAKQPSLYIEITKQMTIHIYVQHIIVYPTDRVTQQNMYT